MSFAALHKAITYVVAGLGIVCLFLGKELSLLAEVVIALAFVASWFAEGPRIADPRWQRGWTAAIVALVALQVVRGLAGEALLPLGLEVAAALQISRLCTRHRAAEHLQIGMLAFLHVCSAAALSTDLAYGVTLFGFILTAPWLLTLTHLRAEIESHYRGSEDGARDGVDRVLASRRIVGPSFFVGTALLSLPLFALTAALFVLFPRVGLGMFTFGRGDPAPVTGFGSDVELGQVGLLRTDPTVVLRVQPADLPPNPPQVVSLRMRGTSFDRYDGRRWSRTFRDTQIVPREGSTFLIERPPSREHDRAVRVMLDHLDEPVVFLPDDAVAVEVPPRVRSGVDIPRRLVREPGLDLRYDSDGLGLQYTAWVAAGASHREAPLAANEAAYYLQVPPGHERIAALAQAWTEGARTDRERAERIAETLRSFDYSLEMRDPGERVPLEAFLFEWRAGHCEYFSTAMAIMLRSLAIPTRNVTGFLGGRWNAWGGWYALSGGDAHSWVEVWLEGEGWVTFDPTPAGRSQHGLVAGLWAELRAVVDALRTRWETAVVGYDLSAQRTLARRLARFLRESRARTVADEPTATSEAPSSSGSRSWLLVGIAVVVVVFVGGRLFWRRRSSSSARRRASSASAREVVALYRELERALTVLGEPRPADRTPQAHARALAERGFVYAEDVALVTQRYEDVRFGGSELTDGELVRLRARIRAMRAPRR